MLDPGSREGPGGNAGLGRRDPGVIPRVASESSAVLWLCSAVATVNVGKALVEEGQSLDEARSGPVSIPKGGTNWRRGWQVCQGQMPMLSEDPNWGSSV